MSWILATLDSLPIEIIDGDRSAKYPKREEFLDEGMPFLNSTNIVDNRLDLTETNFVSIEKYNQIRKGRFQAGDILMTTRGSIGKVAWMPPGLKGLINAQMLILRVDPNALDGRFLFSVLSSDNAQQSLKNFASGSAQPQIPIRDLRQISIRVPDLVTQRRIATILSAYDDLIENNTRRIAILEEMARRIYEEWFVRFRFPGHEDVPMVESELGLVPAGWIVKQLNEVATITMGFSPKGDTYNEDGQGMPLINGPVEFGEKFAKRVKWTTAPTKTCKDGDLIVCVRGSTTGKYVKSDGVYCLGRGVCALSSSYQCFVDQLFLHQLPILLNQTGGSTFPSWTGPQLKSHPVLIPPIDLLTRFEANVGAMSAAVLTYSRKNTNLRTTRDLLLPKLITGELDVSTLPEPQAEST
jgi:type I restriction enzyme S subunit